MAGIGVDAMIMAETDDRLKDAIGPGAMTCLAGNVSGLVGMTRLPDARCDDGRLDLFIAAPHTVRHWLTLVLRLVTRRPQTDGDVIGECTPLAALVKPRALMVCTPGRGGTGPGAADLGGGYRDADMRTCGWWRRARAAVLLVLVLGVVTGCGLPLPGRPEPTPVPLPPDRLVLSVQSYSPLAGELYDALTGPALAVYGDGRVFTYRDDRAHLTTPAVYAVATAGPDAAARLAAEAEASGLFDPDVEYGYPDPTDLPATVVTLHGASGPRTVTVSGYDDTFDKYVSFGQRRLRRQLRALVDRAREVRGDGVPIDYQVERVAVREFDPTYPMDNEVPQPWPGPDPDTVLAPTGQGYGVIACGVLTAEPARTAYAMALTNPGQTWSIGAKQRNLAVVPILPGHEPCPA